MKIVLYVEYEKDMWDIKKALLPYMRLDKIDYYKRTTRLAYSSEFSEKTGWNEVGTFIAKNKIKGRIIGVRIL